MPRPKPLVSLHGAVNFDKLVPFDSAPSSPPLSVNDILVMRRAAGGDNVTLSIGDITATGAVNIADLLGGANDDMLYRVAGIWTGTGGVGLTFDGVDFVLDGAGQVALTGGASVNVADAGDVEVTGTGSVIQSGTGQIRASNATGPALLNLAASATVPNILPDRSDADTGISYIASTLILRAQARTLLTADGPNDNVVFNGVDIHAGNANGPIVINFNPTEAIPVFRPRRTDTDTGLGAPAGTTDIVSLTAGGVEIVRAVEDTVNQFIVSPGAVFGTSALPSLAFGNGDTGFHESVDNILKASVGGLATFQWIGDQFRSETGTGAVIFNEAVSATNPTVAPNVSDQDTGLGQGTADQLDLIAGALSCMAVRNTAAARQIGFYVTAPISLQTGVAVTAAGIHAALVALGLITA